MTYLTLNGLDVFPYTRAAHDQGWDVADGSHIEPHFGGSVGLSQIRAWVSDSVDNRQWTIPLILEAADTGALHELVRDIEGQLYPGGKLRFKYGEETEETCFDVRRGKLDVEWQYWLGREGKTRAVLTLWTGPYGYDEDPVLVSSRNGGTPMVVSGTGPQSLDLLGVGGDVEALGVLSVTTGSAIASSGRVIAYGVHPHASYAPLHQPTIGNAQSGATTVGASGAVGSQALRIPVSPIAASGIAYTHHLAPPDAFVGRHRIFAVARAQVTGEIGVHARDRFNNPLGATATLRGSGLNRSWKLLDLGEINVEAGPSGVATQVIRLVAGGRPDNGPVPFGALAPALELNQLALIPVDRTPGVLRTPPADDVLFFDSFVRFPAAAGNDGPPLLNDFAESDSGHLWRHIGGPQLGRSIAAPMPQNSFSESGIGVAASAAGARAIHYVDRLLDQHELTYTWRAGQMELFDISGAVGTLTASGVEIRTWLKEQGLPFTRGAYVSYVPGGATPHVALAVQNDVGTTVLHRTYLSTMGTVANMRMHVPMNFKATIEGNRAVVTYDLTDYSAATTLLAGTLAGYDLGIARPGKLAIDMISGARATVFGISAQWAPWGLQPGISVTTPNATPGMPRELYTFDSIERQVVQGTAFDVDRQANFRGLTPRMTPGRSKLVVLSGDPENFVGNELITVAMRAREQFRFLR